MLSTARTSCFAMAILCSILLQAGDLLLLPPSQGAAMASSSASMPWLLSPSDRAQRPTRAAAARRLGPPSAGFPGRDTPEQRRLSQMAAERLAREQQRQGVVPQRPLQGTVERSSMAPQQPPVAAAISGQQAGTRAAGPPQEQQEVAPRTVDNLEQEEVPVNEPPRLFPAPETELPYTGGRRLGRVASALQARRRTSGPAARQVSAGDAGMRRTASQARSSADRSGLAASRRGKHVPSNTESEAMHQAMKEQLMREEEQRMREEAKQRPRRRTRKAAVQDEIEYLSQSGPPAVQVRSTF